MPKTLTINKCSQCPFCYDNGVDMHCAECERLGVESVFAKDSFDGFPEDCPLGDAKQLMAVIKDLFIEIVQSASDLETMAEFALEVHGNGYFARMCMAQIEESLKTTAKHKDIIEIASKKKGVSRGRV